MKMRMRTGRKGIVVDFCLDTQRPHFPKWQEHITSSNSCLGP